MLKLGYEESLGLQTTEVNGVEGLMGVQAPTQILEYSNMLCCHASCLQILLEESSHRVRGPGT